MGAERRSALDRFLGLFAEVRAGEGLSALLLAVNVFLLLTSYYIMKPVREALILAAPGGAELKSYMSAGQTLLLLLFVPAYARLASRLPRRRLLNGVTLFFAACLVAFWLLGTSTTLPLGVPFFLWIGIFSVSLVAQFWSFANDLYTPEQGKRLFAILGFGASAGAVFGATSVKGLIAPLGLMGSLLVAGAVLLVSLVFTNWVDARASDRRPAVAKQAEEPMGDENPYRLVFGRRYLLLIALLILLLNWVNSTGEYILGKVVSEAARAAAAATPGAPAGFVNDSIGRFYGDFYGVVNAASLVVQLFLVSRILKYIGVRAALLILPVIAFAGYALAAFVPVLGIIRWSKTAENATDYSLMNTLKGVLFLPTTREEKYKAKQAIDTLFMRAGDVLSAALVFAGTTWLGFAARQFALVNLGLVLVWLVIALRIGREFQRLTAAKG
ncbi:MAG: MFS transporter [Candidatus Latescibacteria bacterium]|nr:MFS transporter [Candidatus Latescibacterota bacterium]